MRRQRSGPFRPKLGFIVQGDVDKRVVDVLAHKVAARVAPGVEPRVGIIRLVYPPRVHDPVPEILFLAEKGYAPALLVFGSDEEGMPPPADWLQGHLLANRVHSLARMVPVEPSIEAWVLADRDAVRQVAGRPPPPRAKRGRRLQPGEFLERWLGDWGPAQQDAVAQLLEPDRIRPHSPSFQRFEKLIQEVLQARSGPQPQREDTFRSVSVSP